jgi:alpha-N-arabinofuranosidase
MADALAFGGACISLLNHADRVKVGCLAQLVNAIAPIMTETGGPAWRQTIFWPFADFSNLGRGRVLRSHITSPTYAATYYDPRGAEQLYFPLPEIPYLKFSAVHDSEGGKLTVFALNRNLDEPMTMAVDARGFRGMTLSEAHTLHDADLAAVNTKDEPDRIRPTPLSGVSVNGTHLSATLPPASWSVIRLEVGG